MIEADRTELRASQPSMPDEQEPIRTCIGCRRRDSWSVLVRVVAGKRDAGSTRVVVDPRHRLPGRGAWLHPDPQCLEHAVRRRAFVRALRLEGGADVTDLTAYLATRSQKQNHTTRPEGGSNADEHPMRTQR